MYPLAQSATITVPIFVHDVSGDAVTGLVDGGFTKRISKNGGAFGAMTVTITEMENGFYSVPISAAHSDTTGILTMLFTHGSSKQINLQFRVHARLPDDLAYPTTSGRSIDVTAAGEVGLDLDNTSGTLAAAQIATGAITAEKFAAGAIDAAALSADAGAEIADAMLDRDMSTGTDSGSTTVRTVRQALRALRNKVAIVGTTMTVNKEDDTTASWTATLTTDAAADPITTIDPAG